MPDTAHCQRGQHCHACHTHQGPKAIVAEFSPLVRAYPYPPRRGGEEQTNTGSKLSVRHIGKSLRGGGTRLHGLRNPRDPPNPSLWEQHNLPWAHTMRALTRPSPPPVPSVPPGWADRKLPQKEKANNC